MSHSEQEWNSGFAAGMTMARNMTQAAHGLCTRRLELCAPVHRVALGAQLAALDGLLAAFQQRLDAAIPANNS